MSVSHRSIARLPVEIFEGLSDESVAAIDLRAAISKQLKSVAKKKSFRTVYVKVLTVGPFLQLSVTTLMRALDPLLTYHECLEFRRRVAEACSPKSVTAWSLLENDATFPQKFLPTGLLPLDKGLLGGIRVRTLTELVGSAGSGKTQFAMQMMVTAAAKRQGTIFIDTEQKLSLPRLQEIALEKHACNVGSSLLFDNDSSTNDAQSMVDDYVDPNLVLKNLSVYSPASMDELMNVLSSMEEEILLRNEEAEKDPELNFPVRLVVLDSIAAPARRDFAPGSGPQRAAAVMFCSQKLKQMADHLNMAILVINQVGGSWNSDDKASDTSTRAALGTTWHHCVTTRILLESAANLPPAELSDGSSVPVPGSNPLRWASVVKSNIVGHGSKIPFTIDKAGLVADRHANNTS